LKNCVNVGHDEPEHDDQRHCDAKMIEDNQGRSASAPRGLSFMLTVSRPKERADLAGDFAGANDLDPVRFEDLWGSRSWHVEQCAGLHLGGDLPITLLSFCSATDFRRARRP
jgi:hypothetical protein